MERIMGTLKHINIGMVVVAAILLSCAPLAFVGSAFGSEGGSDDKDNKAGIEMPSGQAAVSCWAFIAAALATGIGSVAAGFAVSNVGTAAMGAVAEKPELMGKSLIYVALAEGIAIYGLLIAIIVLAKV